MNSVYQVFADLLDVTWEEDSPRFNGFETPYTALLQIDPMYRSLSFADQMEISAAILQLTSPLNEAVPTADIPETMIEGRVFMYTYQWMPSHSDYACVILDTETGEVMFDEWFNVLHQHKVMDHVKDLEGLVMFLVQSGDLIDGDTVLLQNDDEEDEEDELGL